MAKPIAAAFLALPLAWGAAGTPARAAQPFDGAWSVEVITEQGTCDKAYRWDVVIRDGQISTTADMPTGATGLISPRGLVSARFERGKDLMVASGSAEGKWATGAWVAASLNCSGRWRAEKRA